jgi:hypothetical protein
MQWQQRQDEDVVFHHLCCWRRSMRELKSHNPQMYRSKSQRVGGRPVGWARGSICVYFIVAIQSSLDYGACRTLSGESIDFSPHLLCSSFLCVFPCVCVPHFRYICFGVNNLGRKVSSHEPTVPTNPFRPAPRAKG